MINDHSTEEIKTAVEVLEDLKGEYPEESDEYADISQTQHYLKSRVLSRKP